MRCAPIGWADHRAVQGVAQQVDEDTLFLAKVTTMIIFAAILVVVVFEAQVSVDAGHVGVVTQYGRVTGTTFAPGLHFKTPFTQQVVDMNVQVQKDQTASTAASEDLQTVDTTVAVNYHLNPKDAGTVYQNIGIGYQDTVIAPSIQEVIKAVTAQYTAGQLITRRAIVQSAMQDALTTRLAQDYIVVDNLSIINFAFSDAYNQAIERKQVASQNVLTAQQTLDQARVDAQQQVVTAQAQAQAAIAKANGAATAQIITAKANAASQALQLKTLNATYLEKIFLDKWNGTLPQYLSGSLPFLTIPAPAK
jgi:regulator of protease activity HflC (stomatin/prohibitin superfamily)